MLTPKSTEVDQIFEIANQYLTQDNLDLIAGDYPEVIKGLGAWGHHLYWFGSGRRGVYHACKSDQ